VLFGESTKISLRLFCGSQIAIYVKKTDTRIHTYPFAKNNYNWQFYILFSYAVISFTTIIMQLSLRKLW